jgi:hypothetical protein
MKQQGRAASSFTGRFPSPTEVEYGLAIIPSEDRVVGLLALTTLLEQFIKRLGHGSQSAFPVVGYLHPTKPFGCSNPPDRPEARPLLLFSNRR